VPVLAIFYGIVITIYWADHPPPHVHARYAEFEAQIDIARGQIMEGSLPRQARRMVLEWTREHQVELMEAWQAADVGTLPARIAPLR
jgi:hypothetical protein